MTMITPSYLGETIEYSSLHACRSTLEDPTSLPEIPVSDERPTRWTGRPKRDSEQSIAQSCGGRGDSSSLNDQGSGRENGGKLFEFTRGGVYGRKYADRDRHSSRCPSLAQSAFGCGLALVGRTQASAVQLRALGACCNRSLRAVSDTRFSIGVGGSARTLLGSLKIPRQTL